MKVLRLLLTLVIGIPVLGIAISIIGTVFESQAIKGLLIGFAIVALIYAFVFQLGIDDKGMSDRGRPGDMQ